MDNSLIKRQAAIDAVKRLSLGETDATRLAMRIGDYLERLQSAQPDGKIMLDKEAILQAGYQGREVDFRIGGRLFAIREKAQ